LSFAVRSAYPFEVVPVADPFGGVLQGAVADLTLDPGAVDGNRPRARSERSHDAGDRRFVEFDASDLRQNRLFPDLVTESCALAPIGTGVHMELAVATVVERPVAPDPTSTDALEEASQ